MGQPIGVLELPSPEAGVVMFELNRVLTGTGHERYSRNVEITGSRPPDELARRLFEFGDAVSTVHVYNNIVTIGLRAWASSEGLADVIRDLYTYYTPGKLPSL